MSNKNQSLKLRDHQMFVMGVYSNQVFVNGEYVTTFGDLPLLSMFSMSYDKKKGRILCVKSSKRSAIVVASMRMREGKPTASFKKEYKNIEVKAREPITQYETSFHAEEVIKPSTPEQVASRERFIKGLSQVEFLVHTPNIKPSAWPFPTRKGVEEARKAQRKAAEDELRFGVVMNDDNSETPLQAVQRSVDGDADHIWNATKPSI